MNLYNTFESDEKAEAEGIILEYGLNSKEEPIQIRIRRGDGSNVRFAKVFERKSAPFRRIMSIPGALDQKVSDRVMRECYAEAVVVSWSGVEDRDGNPMEFSKDNVLKLFSDLPDLFRDVVRQSQNEALFRRELREAEAGN